MLRSLLAGLSGAGEGAALLKRHDDEKQARAIEIMRLENARRRYDPARGGIVDEGAGSFAPIPNLPAVQRQPDRAYDPSRGAIVDLDTGSATVPAGLPSRMTSQADPYGGRSREQWLKDQTDLENIRNASSPESQILGEQRRATNIQRAADTHVAAAAARLGRAATPQQIIAAAQSSLGAMKDTTVTENDLYAAFQRRNDASRRGMSAVDRILESTMGDESAPVPASLEAPPVARPSAQESVPPGLTIEQLQRDYDQVRKNPDVDQDTKYKATMRYIRLKRALSGQ